MHVPHDVRLGELQQRLSHQHGGVVDQHGRRPQLRPPKLAHARRPRPRAVTRHRMRIADEKKDKASSNTHPLLH